MPKDVFSRTLGPSYCCDRTLRMRIRILSAQVLDPLYLRDLPTEDDDSWGNSQYIPFSSQSSSGIPTGDSPSHTLPSRTQFFLFVTSTIRHFYIPYGWRFGHESLRRNRSSLHTVQDIPLRGTRCTRNFNRHVSRAVNRTVYGYGRTFHGEYTVSGRTVSYPYLHARENSKVGD
jgi:hypothetical protein